MATEFDDELTDIKAAWQAGQLTDDELEALLGPMAERMAAAKATASPADEGEASLVKAAHEAESLAKANPEAAVVLRLAVAVCAGVLAWKRFGK